MIITQDSGLSVTWSAPKTPSSVEISFPICLTLISRASRPIWVHLLHRFHPPAPSNFSELRQKRNDNDDWMQSAWLLPNDDKNSPFAFSNSLIKGMTALHPNHRSCTHMINARRPVKSCVLHIKRAAQMRKCKRMIHCSLGSWWRSVTQLSPLIHREINSSEAAIHELPGNSGMTLP